MSFIVPDNKRFKATARAYIYGRNNVIVNQDDKIIADYFTSFESAQSEAKRLNEKWEGKAYCDNTGKYI